MIAQRERVADLELLIDEPLSRNPVEVMSGTGDIVEAGSVVVEFDGTITGPPCGSLVRRNTSHISPTLTGEDHESILSLGPEWVLSAASEPHLSIPIFATTIRSTGSISPRRTWTR